MSTTYFIANWKLNHNLAKTKDYIARLTNYQNPNAKLVICPPYPLINLFASADLTTLSYGSQNIADESSGAFTGEVSGELLKELGCQYSIIGHSERRQLYLEDNKQVAKKLDQAFTNNITPILCVGETLQERESGDYKNIISKQINSALEGANITTPLIIAYEPVWAIGTGLIPKDEQIEEVFSLILDLLSRLNIASHKVTILYGGSANAKNLANLLKIPNIGGFLIGSASLEADNLIKMADFVK
ncbi:MAG: triose-phosphate isomerase [Rickettsiales bacterium]|jgi:triosephosphate isomerase (TIM)|nr:triose-phosphate isomerase [Rickettsiales bacterium]